VTEPVRPNAPLSERLCDAVAVGLALWTLCCHAVVALGGSLFALMGSFAAAAALAVAATRVARRRAGRAPVDLVAEASPALHRAPALRIAGLTVAVALGGAYALSESPRALFLGAVALLGAALVAFVLRDAPHREPARRTRGAEIALWVTAVLCVALALALHRPDLDDSFYVNVAVAAADAPGAALMARDTMLGVPALPLHLPAHRVHSYELFNGALAYLTGAPAVVLFHGVAAAFGALLVPLAHARLFRLLTPRIWPVAVIALVFVLFAAGGTHRWYANFAFPRIWQGKALYLYVFMPLVYAYALRFGLRPSLSGWLLLFSAQVAALGCSSTAIWAAPLGAVLACCASAPPGRAGVRIVALASLASFYVLAVGLVLKGSMQPLLAPLIEPGGPGEDLASSLSSVFGRSNLLPFGLAASLGAWACCPRGLARRFAIVVPLAVFAVLLNPYLSGWVSRNLSGPSYWRVLWTLPVPVLLALVLVAPLRIGAAGERRGLRIGACAALFLIFALVIAPFSTLSPRNGGAAGVGNRLAWPGVKAPETAWRFATAINELTPAGAVVVAPADISAWIPLFHHHAYPLQARRIYLYHHVARLGADDVSARREMTLYVGGVADADDATPRFAAGLDRFDVKAVCLRNSKYAREAREVLRRAGFERRLQSVDHEIWVRS
jgi:hypothetical protein